jgi:hypothetical protein
MQRTDRVRDDTKCNCGCDLTHNPSVAHVVGDAHGHRVLRYRDMEHRHETYCGRQEMKTPWTGENAWAEEDHGDFWVPQKRFPRRVKGQLWLVALAVVSAVVWIAIHAAGAA